MVSAERRPVSLGRSVDGVAATLRAMIRAILFDFGGTLDCLRHWLDRFVAHYQAAGIDLKRAELENAFSIATRNAYFRSAMLRDYSLLQLVRFLIDLQFGILVESGAAAPRGLLAKVSSGSSIEAVKSQIADAFVAESEAGLAISRPLL